MTGLEIIAALSGMITILDALINKNNRENDQEKNALLALNDAVTSTEKYLSLTDKQSATSESNYELTNAWHKASLLFRDAGHERMQILCSIKGEYWLDPTIWNDKQIKDAGIKLSEMRARLNKALNT